MILSSSTRPLIASKFWRKQFLNFHLRQFSSYHRGSEVEDFVASFRVLASRNFSIYSRYCYSAQDKDPGPASSDVDGSGSKDSKSQTATESKTLGSKLKGYISMRRDYSQKYTANNTLTAVRAMREYVLSPSDLDGLPKIKIRSPYAGASSPIIVYLESDVEKRAMKVWGSTESLEKERKRIKKLDRKQQKQIRLLGEVLSEHSTERKQKLMSNGSARVVAYAAAANAAICSFKFGCFITTGSASMFSEVMHSLADTCNQLLLLWGVNESLKKPDVEHPYGFGNMRHIMSLISGVGIFCIGCGASIYHGIQVLAHPTMGVDVASPMSFMVLAGSAIIESISLVVAINETRSNAKKNGISFTDYVNESRDPSTNVVLLEDSAAVLGVGIAGAALAMTHYAANPVYDAIGSIAIGGLLGAVASFLVTTNVNALIGRSIPQSQLQSLQETLEDDAVVRGVYDVKATQINADEFKFKAEIDFDGREITRAYLASVDMEKVLREIHGVRTLEELEQVILRYGEHVIDTLGVQVDRIELELKKKHPHLRHIDLEVL
ncbi:proton-coupled zinc antiporter SLC30A9, mitochondrial-like [Clavelina lepadiformis]|uniref:proton-coupled zinc antiporter SLC30A9, mitochondrial-like n=1 Tax=Clavelina lepadiformis TaxID=159417 RepID=UPI004042FA7E